MHVLKTLLIHEDLPGSARAQFWVLQVPDSGNDIKLAVAEDALGTVSEPSNTEP